MFPRVIDLRLVKVQWLTQGSKYIIRFIKNGKIYEMWSQIY